MTLLHLPCGKPMVQLTPLVLVVGVGELPAAERSTAWCPHCAATDSAQQGGETDNPDRSVDVLGVGVGRVQRPVLVGSEHGAAVGSNPQGSAAARPDGAVVGNR